MKSTTFRLDCKSSNCISTPISKDHYRYEFTIPILEAYAIDYFLLVYQATKVLMTP